MSGGNPGPYLPPPAVSSSRPAAGPLARLSALFASVRPGPKDPAETPAQLARRSAIYFGDETQSSDDDEAKKRAVITTQAVVVGAQSLHGASSMESVAAAGVRTRNATDNDKQWLGAGGSEPPCQSSFFRRNSRFLIFAAVLVAFVLSLGLGLGLGLRSGSPGLLVSANGPFEIPPSDTAGIPLTHPSPTFANASSSAHPTSNSTTVIGATPPTSAASLPTSQPSSETAAPTQPPPSELPAPSAVPSAPTDAPAPTQAPAPAPAPAPPPPTAPAPAPGNGPFAGDVTFYTPGLGACGSYSGASDAIVAVSASLFDAAGGGGNPNRNPLCGRRIRVSLAGAVGATVDVTIVDRCEACAANDVDLSPGAFSQLAGASVGRAKGSWFFLS